MRLHLFQKEWYNIYIKRLDSAYISMKIIKNYIENFDKYPSKEEPDNFQVYYCNRV